METHGNLLEIEIERIEVSWLAGVFSTLTPGVHSITLRLVGRVDGEIRYQSGSFSSTHMFFTPTDPDEAYTPEMTENLMKLRQQIEGDGWVQTGRGTQSWAFTYTRPEDPTNGR